MGSHINMQHFQEHNSTTVHYFNTPHELLVKTTQDEESPKRCLPAKTKPVQHID